MVSAISSLSNASISEMRQQMFSKIDTSGDGSIDKTEMSALIEQNASSFVDTLFGNLDTDQDSLISMIESDSGLAKLEQQMRGDGMSDASGMHTPPPPPEKVFDTADANGDGTVTKDELSAVLGGNGGNIDALFSQVDGDGDGVITRTEDEAFRETMPERIQQDNISNLGTDNGFGEDWKVKMFDALLQSLTAAAGSSSNTTSLDA